MAKTALQKIENVIKTSERLQRQLPTEAVGVAQQIARLNYDGNVTETPAGKYRRTGKTRDSISIESAGRGRFRLFARYGAPFVEMGTPAQWNKRNVRINWVSGTVTGIPGMSRTDQKRISIGRSGTNWKVPGPFLEPAAIAAVQHMRTRFLEEMKRTSRRR